MKHNPAAIALIWIGAVAFIVGAIVGLVPMDANFGSAWFPAPGTGGMHTSSMGVSVTLMLIGAAAGITGTVLLSSKK